MFPTYGSLFAGVGGFDMGFDNAGYECRFQVEWDKNCQAILSKHWPDVPKWSDVRDVHGAEIPPVDVLIFGSPCQDLSVAGKRAGLDGERSGLFFEAMRIIKEMRDATGNAFPRIVVWENVVGALNSNGGADFGAVLDKMAETGAVDIEWAVLDAQYFGVPQRRRRVFVVAIFDSSIAEHCPNPLLPVSEGVRGDSKKGRKKGKDAASEVAACLRSGGSGGVPSSRGEHLVIDSEVPNPEEQLSFTSMNFGGWDETEVAGTLSQRDYKDGRTITIGSGKDVVNTISASLYHHGTVVNQDANNGHVVVESTDDSIVFHPHRGDGVRLQENGTVNTLTAFMGTGGLNTPMVAQSDGDEVVAFATNQRAEVRELGDKAVALSAEPGTNQQTYITQPIGIQGNMIGRSDTAGPQGKGYTDDGDPMFTLTSTDIHGVVAPIGFSHTQGLSAQPSEEAWPTLRSEGSGHAVAIPIQDGRDIEKHQNGLGVGESGDPSYTLDQTGAQSVAYVVRMREGKPGGGKGPLLSEDVSLTLATANDQTLFVDADDVRPDSVMPTLLAGMSHLTGTTQDPYIKKVFETQHSESYDEYNDTLGGDVHHALRAGTKQSTGVVIPSLTASNDPSRSPQSSEVTQQVSAVYDATMVVRRLTPVECERLMGWPDDHTRWRVDGKEQADSHRYRQCGNGVATPVAQWIAGHLFPLVTR